VKAVPRQNEIRRNKWSVPKCFRLILAAAATRPLLILVERFDRHKIDYIRNLTEVCLKLLLGAFSFRGIFI
jgi:hypothetical protein